MTEQNVTPIDAGRRTGRPRLRAAGRRASGPVWNWRAAARCRAADAEDLFVTGAPQREARDFCFACPVRTECLAHALDQQVEFGVWGGMTERERRAVLRRRPDVTDWAGLLSRARSDHYSGRGA
ncbi:WhiB family transcriptional regulator [Pseudonocardia nantongensis]|uniref:WhiB family transcriptional regulator n=1 Tax=Pseudonocardia nantongensis TaxID=1181885 RepID=UPI00397A2131